ncbi:MAG: hypothetical protein NZ789_19915 [Pseudomonadales bacterium]|nr:hypothetical protein [Pseudomonadales bacterium]
MKLDQSALQAQVKSVNKELSGIGVCAAVYLKGELITTPSKQNGHHRCPSDLSLKMYL